MDVLFPIQFLTMTCLFRATCFYCMSLYAKYSIFGREFMQAGLWLANNLSLFAITMTQQSKTGPGPAGILFCYHDDSAVQDWPLASWHLFRYHDDSAV